MSLDATSQTSTAQKVADFSNALGFCQPRWQREPSLASSGNPIPANASYYDMAAFYQDRDAAREPQLAGPLGKVERVYGMKNAKKACAERVLLVLEEIMKGRT